MRYPIENTGNSPMFVAGKMIHPGETLTFEEEDLPPELRPGAALAAEELPPDPLLAILALSIAKAALGLPELSDEELKQIETLEMENQNRKGMLAEITMETLRRAELAASNQGANANGSTTDENGKNEAGAAGEGAGEPGADLNTGTEPGSNGG